MNLIKILIPPIIGSIAAAIVTVLILKWLEVESSAIIGGGIGGAVGGATAGLIASRQSSAKKTGDS